MFVHGYVHVCVCAAHECICTRAREGGREGGRECVERETERERERDREREREGGKERERPALSLLRAMKLLSRVLLLRTEFEL